MAFPRASRFFLALFLSFSLHAFAGASEELRVEGITYDPSAPVAAINGDVYEKGQEIGDYRIADITPSSVKLIHLQSGEEKWLEVTANAALPPAPEAEIAAAPETAPASVPTPLAQSVPPEEISQLEKLLSSSKPEEAMARALEIGVVMDLKRIQMAAAFAGHTSGSVSFKQLVDSDLLPPIYKEGRKGGYKFRIVSVGKAVEVYADPEQDGPKKKHYLADHFGVVYFELGQPATNKSEAFGL